MEHLTLIEVYKRIQFVVAMSAMVKNLTPNSTMTEDKATRLGNIEAVKHCWYYFNNQGEFNKLPLMEFYYSKDKQ